MTVPSKNPFHPYFGSCSWLDFADLLEEIKTLLSDMFVNDETNDGADNTYVSSFVKVHV